MATATLADTAPAPAFAGALPLELELGDPMGQAKSGPLPHPLPGPFGGEGSEPVDDPQVGQLYYFPTSSTFAIYYDDLGQTVPAPGLVRLGAVDTGLAAISDAGNHLDLQIRALAPTGS